MSNVVTFTYRWTARNVARAIDKYVPNPDVPPERVAVMEYDGTNGRKRRAVVMPGHYPNLSLSPSKNAAVAAPNPSPATKSDAAAPSYLNTTSSINAAENKQPLPAGRPLSSRTEKNKAIVPKQQNHAASSMMAAQTASIPSLTAETGVLPTPLNSRPSSSHIPNNNNQQPQSQAPNQHIAGTIPIPKPGTGRRSTYKHSVFASSPRALRLPADCYPKSILKNQRRDREVEARCERAKNVTFLSPQEKAVIVAHRTRKATAAEEYAFRINREAEERRERRESDEDRRKAKEERRREKREETRAKAAAYQAEVEREKAEAKAEKQRLKDEAKAEKERLDKEAEERRAAHEAKLAAERAHFKEIGEPDDDSFLVELSRKANLITTLSTDWEEKINEQMAVKNPQHSVVTAANGVDLTRYDFGRLLPQKGTKDPDNGWLNDNLVNAFMSTIVASKKEQTGWKARDGAPAFEAYDSTWFVKYQESGIDAISRWSTRKKIKGHHLLKCDKIFFPASKNNHWTLLIISPKERKIEYLDSLGGGGNRKVFFRIAREWLAMELGVQYDASEWTEEDTQSQMQHNGDDCGVFTCFNALASVKDGDFQFVDGTRMYEARRLAAAILMKGRLAEEFEL